MRWVLQLTQCIAGMEIPGLRAGRGDENRTQQSLWVKKSEFREVNVARTCGAEYRNGWSCTERGLDMYRETSVSLWLSDLHVCERRLLRLWKGSPQRNKLNNSWSSHRPWNSSSITSHSGKIWPQFCLLFFPDFCPILNVFRNYIYLNCHLCSCWPILLLKFTMEF